MRNADKYVQVDETTVACELPIEMSSSLAEAKGWTGVTENRVNEKDPTKSRVVRARKVKEVLVWDGVTTAELVHLASLQVNANMLKPVMWQAPMDEHGNVDLGRVNMREVLDARKAGARGAASAEAKEKAAKVRKVEAALNAQGLSLDQILALLAQGKLKVEA